MKLSAMKVPQLAKTLAKLAPSIGKLTANPAVGKFFADYANAELTPQLALSGIMNMLPAFLSDNYTDTIQIICVLSGKTKAEIEDMTLAELVPTVKDIADADLIKVFH